MLTTDDKKEVRKIVKEVIEPLEGRVTNIKDDLDLLKESVDFIRGSLAKIENTIGILQDIWEFIKDHSKRLDDHEESIKTLENQPKL